MLENSTLIVVDENGQEKEMEILFTFEDDEKGKKYVLYFDPQAEDDEVFASIYDEEGHLYPIETDEEWEMVEEVLGAFSGDFEQEQQ